MKDPELNLQNKELDKTRMMIKVIKIELKLGSDVKTFQKQFNFMPVSDWWNKLKSQAFLESVENLEPVNLRSISAQNDSLIDTENTRKHDETSSFHWLTPATKEKFAWFENILNKKFERFENFVNKKRGSESAKTAWNWEKSSNEVQLIEYVM